MTITTENMAEKLQLADGESMFAEMPALGLPAAPPTVLGEDLATLFGETAPMMEQPMESMMKQPMESMMEQPMESMMEQPMEQPMETDAQMVSYQCVYMMKH